MVMSKENNKLIKAYQNLTPDLQEIIQILGIHVKALSQGNTIAAINLLRAQNGDDTSATYKTFRPLLTELKSRGLVFQKSDGISCPEGLAFHAAKDAVKNNRFEKIFLALLPSDPISFEYYDYNYLSVQEVYKALQAAVYCGDKFFDIHEVYQYGVGRFPMEFAQDPPFLKLFNRPFQPELFNRFESDIGLAVIAYMLNESEKICEPVTDILDYSQAVFFLEHNLQIKYKIAGSFLLHGRKQEFETLVGDMGDTCPWHLEAFRGWAQMISNKNTTALTYFKKALAIFKKETGKRKLVILGNVGFIFLFALLKSENIADHRAGLTYVETALNTEKSSTTSFKGIKLIFQEKLGIITSTSENLEVLIDSQTIVQNFFDILILSWLDLNKAKMYIHELEIIKNNAAVSGYLWIEAEACALLAILGKDIKTNQNHSEKIHRECSTTTITDVVHPEPQWKRKLKVLMNIGRQVTVSKSGLLNNKPVRVKRLVWILEYSDEYKTCNIKPRLQTLSKNKTWTKGRAVALKNLYHNRNVMDELTEHDIRVCMAITESKLYQGGYYYGRRVDYNLDLSKALPTLAGHPFIFLETSLANPVELVIGEPELRLRVIKDKINIVMDHVPGVYDDMLVIRETPSRFKVICFSKEQLKLAGCIEKDGLEFPIKAKKIAIDAMECLSPVITINSDLVAKGGKQTKTIKADSAINVHVMPWQEGISIEFLVRPFGKVGSYFKPGRGGKNVFAEIKGEKTQTIRDLNHEKKLLQNVIEQCSTLDLLEKVDGQWLVGDPEDALELLLELKNLQEKVVMFWPQGEKMKIKAIASFDDFKLDIKTDREWFQANGSLKIDENTALDLSKLMKLLAKSSHRFVTLDDGTFLAITNTLKERLEELYIYSTPHNKGVRFSPLAAPAMEELLDKTKNIKSDKAWRDNCKKLKEIIKPEIPGTLQANLRSYQKTGFSWLSQLAHWNVGACLADDMGLGKTVQALAAILVHASRGPTLIIAPLSVMTNWVEECHNFAPTLNPLIFGSGDRKMFLDNLKPFDVVISSYGLLQIEGEKLANVTFQTIVLDEAQAIKNMNTKRSKAAMQLKAKFRIITTGTPVENHLDELWTLFNFLNPGLLGSIQNFKTRFILPIERDHDKKASQKLKKLIQPFILRRLKTDVLKELPKKTEITLEVEMSKEETLLYEAQRLKAIEDIELADDKPGQKHFRILAQLTKLRQLCCNPSLILPNTKIKSSKLKVFGNVVAELLENRHKALVFSQFVGHLTILRKFLDEKKITYQYLDGSTPAKKRKKLIEDFQNGMGDLFLISLKAGGFGLNLTAADYVIHMDPWWNPAVEDQASDRAHRIGQTRPVTVYRLVVKHSIEEKIVTLHKEKRDLADSLLTGSDMAGKISAVELLTLLHENHDHGKIKN